VAVQLEQRDTNASVKLVDSSAERRGLDAQQRCRLVKAPLLRHNQGLKEGIKLDVLDRRRLDNEGSGQQQPAPDEIVEHAGVLRRQSLARNGREARGIIPHLEQSCTNREY
jgi:hypothetical protein